MKKAAYAAIAAIVVILVVVAIAVLTSQNQAAKDAAYKSAGLSSEQQEVVDRVNEHAKEYGNK